MHNVVDLTKVQVAGLVSSTELPGFSIASNILYYVLGEEYPFSFDWIRAKIGYTATDIVVRGVSGQDDLSNVDLRDKSQMKWTYYGWLNL